MKKITFNELKIQNFLSVGKEEIAINFNSGLNLITGKNLDNPERNNGTGKSAIIEAFFFGIFGETIREIKQDLIINTETKGDGRIDLSFEVQDSSGTKLYTIKRRVKPSKVELYVDGTDITKDTITNTNKFIRNLLGTNPVLCKSCDILSLSDNIPFMAKTAAEKRKFIEDVFSLEIFGKMSKDLKDVIKQNKEEMGISSTKLNEMSNTLNTLFEQQTTFLKKIEEREKVLMLRKDELLSKLEKYTAELNSIVILDLSSLEDSKEKYTELVSKMYSKMVEISSDINENKSNLVKKKKDIEKREKIGVGSCESCLQEISYNHIDQLEKQKNDIIEEIKNITSETEDLNVKLEDLKIKKNKVQSKIDEVVNDISQQKINSQKIENLNDLISECRESISQIEKEIEEKDSSTDIFQDSIDKAQKRKEEELEIFGNLKQHADDLDTCKFILSEEGIKSFAVGKLLKILNSGIQQYISELGLSIKCVFDEFFEEKMINDHGKIISYWNLSGGERRTVDLAVSWAFKDLKRKISNIASNLEFCDEIFDSAFDEAGFDLLITVLKKRIDNQNMSIYAISHRKETLKHIDGEVVFLEKQNGITRRVLDKY